MRYRFSGVVGVHYRLNRTVLFWLGLFILTGIVIGLVVVFNSKFTLDSISNNILDSNIRRVVDSAGFGSIIWGRLFGFVLSFAFIFLFCLNKWTVFLVFPFIAYKGFTFVLNLYWAIVKFGMASGLVLFIFYLIFLLAILVVTVIAAVYCMRICSQVRRGGFRGAICWNDFFKAVCVFLIVVAALAVLEWAVYKLVLCKIVFLV